MTRRRGFSLVEVLASLLLLGIVLPAAMRGVTLSLRAANAARNAQEATLLAERQLNTLLAARDADALGSDGTFEDLSRYRWELSTSVVGSELVEATVTIVWLERGEERSRSMTTWILPEGTL